MQISKRIFGLLFIIAGILLFISFQAFHLQIIQLLEFYISPDGRITSGGQRQLNYIFYIFTALLVILGYGLVKAEDDTWRGRVMGLFLSDPLCSDLEIQPTPKFTLITSTMIGLFLIVHIRLYDPASQLFEILYLEDGIFESLTPVLMVISMLLIGASIPKLRRDPQLVRYRNLLTLIYFILISLFFLNAMEEISWGQRIFGWETPQTFEGNVQNETNLHNYFNQYYLLFYRLLVLFPVVIFVSIWLELKQRYLIFNRLVMPHPSMIGLSLLIAIVSLVWYKEQELLEELFAVFFLFYSFRIYSCFRFRGKSKSTGSDHTSFHRPH
jgi:hypothetical protein